MFLMAVLKLMLHIMEKVRNYRGLQAVKGGATRLYFENENRFLGVVDEEQKLPSVGGSLLKII